MSFKAYLNDESCAMIDCIVKSYDIKNSQRYKALDHVILLQGFSCDSKKFDSLIQAIKKEPVLQLVGVRFVKLRHKQYANNAQQLVMLQFEAHNCVKSEIEDIAICCRIQHHLPYITLGKIKQDAMNSFSMFAKYSFSVNIDVEKTLLSLKTLMSSTYQQEANENGLTTMLKWYDIFYEFRTK